MNRRVLLVLILIGCFHYIVTADEVSLICKPEDTSLADQKFKVEFITKKIKMGDDRKIYDVEFSNDTLLFKRALSIRNLDILVTKEPEFFVYMFDKKSMQLSVHLSSNVEKPFDFKCTNE